MLVDRAFHEEDNYHSVFWLHEYGCTHPGLAKVFASAVAGRKQLSNDFVDPEELLGAMGQYGCQEIAINLKNENDVARFARAAEFCGDSLELRRNLMRLAFKRDLSRTAKRLVVVQLYRRDRGSGKIALIQLGSESIDPAGNATEGFRTALKMAAHYRVSEFSDCAIPLSAIEQNIDIVKELSFQQIKSIYSSEVDWPRFVQRRLIENNYDSRPTKKTFSGERLRLWTFEVLLTEYLSLPNSSQDATFLEKQIWGVFRNDQKSIELRAKIATAAFRANRTIVGESERLLYDDAKDILLCCPSNSFVLLSEILKRYPQSKEAQEILRNLLRNDDILLDAKTANALYLLAAGNARMLGELQNDIITKALKSWQQSGDTGRPLLEGVIRPTFGLTYESVRRPPFALALVARERQLSVSVADRILTHAGVYELRDAVQTINASTVADFLVNVEYPRSPFSPMNAESSAHVLDRLVFGTSEIHVHDDLQKVFRVFDREHIAKATPHLSVNDRLVMLGQCKVTRHEDVEFVISSLRSPRPFTRRCALWAIRNSQLLASASDNAATALLRDPHPLVRAEAISTVAVIGKTTERQLQKILYNDSHLDVRHAARQAIHKLRHGGSQPKPYHPVGAGA